MHAATLVYGQPSTSAAVVQIEVTSLPFPFPPSLKSLAHIEPGRRGGYPCLPFTIFFLRTAFAVTLRPRLKGEACPIQVQMEEQAAC